MNVEQRPRRTPRRRNLEPDEARAKSEASADRIRNAGHSVELNYKADPEPHPAAEAFPLMSAERLDQLAFDIQEHGLLEDIVLLDGKVLDGRHRLKACRKAGVEPRFVEYDGDMPNSFVASKNAQRRLPMEGQAPADREGGDPHRAREGTSRRPTCR